MREDQTGWDEVAAPDAEVIEALARAAVATLPAPFRDQAMALTLRTEDFASDVLLAEMEIDDPFALTGLYEGIPLTERAAHGARLQPDTIWLFRRPILDEWAAGGDISLGDLVAHVMGHQIAHHFGWSDEEIARIDPWWE